MGFFGGTELFSPSKKVLAAAGSALAALVLTLLLWQRAFHDEVPLFGKSSPNEAVRIIDYLDRAGADYRIGNGGRIFVSREDAEALRRELAAAGTVRSSAPDGAAAVPAESGGAPFVLWGYALLATAAWGLFLIALRAALRERKGRRPAEAPASFAADPSVPGEPPAPRKAADDRAAEAFEIRRQAELLSEEHPQLLAVYLLGIESGRAAALLGGMPEGLCEAVWLRMLTSRPCPEELQGRVRQLLDEKCAAAAAGIAVPEIYERVREIFRRLSPPLRSELLAAMQRGGLPAERLAAETE